MEDSEHSGIIDKAGRGKAMKTEEDKTEGQCGCVCRLDPKLAAPPSPSPPHTPFAFAICRAADRSASIRRSEILQKSSLQWLWHQGRFCGRQFCHGLGRGCDGLGMIQAHCMYYTLYFYYYCISCTSDHQALDGGGWGPLLQRAVQTGNTCVTGELKGRAKE